MIKTEFLNNGVKSIANNEHCGRKSDISHVGSNMSNIISDDISS